MKKLGIILVVILFVVIGCKKDEIQPSWWDKLWHKETVIMVNLNNKHNNVILPNIDRIREILDEFVMWDEDTIEIWGPGGYTPTAEKAFRVWLESYQLEMMPDDTLTPPTTGTWATIIKNYLSLRRDYDREKAFKKLWLCIPKEIYEQDSHFWEWWFTKVQTYLTVVLGGPDAWTDGTRQMHLEMEIYHLPTTKDPNDPWGYECSAQTRITCWYKSYAEGPSKKMAPVNNEMFRKEQAQMRYEQFLNVPDPEFQIGTPADYETKKVVINGQEFYVLAIPNVPTR